MQSYDDKTQQIPALARLIISERTSPTSGVAHSEGFREEMDAKHPSPPQLLPLPFPVQGEGQGWGCGMSQLSATSTSSASSTSPGYPRNGSVIKVSGLRQ